MFEYDKIGNRLLKMEHDSQDTKFATYLYDNLNRLRIDNLQPRERDYFYDAVGNRIQKNMGVDFNTYYSYDAANQLTSEFVTEPWRSFRIQYFHDANGNLMAKFNNDTGEVKE